MLSYSELVLYSLASLLLPLVIYVIASGTPPPSQGWFAKFYKIEKCLFPFGNVFLLAVCGNAIAKLALHLGYVDPGLTDRVDFASGIAFMLLMIAYLGLWIRAGLKLRNAGIGGKA